MTGLIVALIVVTAGLALWGVVEWDGRHDPRPDTAPIPIVPGRDTPATTAGSNPPWAPAAVTLFPAGGSSVPAAAGQPDENVSEGAGLAGRSGVAVAHVAAAGTPSPPAGERHGPGPDCLPEGNAPGSRSPQEAPGPGALPPEVTAPLDALREVVAELARPTDEQRFPDLMPAWEDDTGSFAAFVEDGAQ